MLQLPWNPGESDEFDRIEGQTLHVGFQALEHRGQLLHQLPGHGLTASVKVP